MLTITLVLLILAVVCFAIAAFNIGAGQTTRINFIALGLLLWVLMPLISTIDRL